MSVNNKNFKVPRYYKHTGRHEGDAKDLDIIRSATSSSLRYQHLPDYNPDESDDDIRKKLSERFAILDIMTREAIESNVTAMIVSGPGGVGKTFTIDSVLDEWDPTREKYTRSAGYMRATGLFKKLYKHRAKGELILLDDMDSIFYDDTSLNFLKVACDTTKKREITYAAETKLVDESTGEVIPNRFTYNGTMIFITNLDFDALIDKGTKLAPHLEALITRSHYIDLMMKTKRDYLIHIFDVANDSTLFDNIGLNDDEKVDVLTFIDKYHKVLRECSLRMAIKIGNLRKGASKDDKIGWERRALLTCCRGVM